MTVYQMVGCHFVLLEKSFDLFRTFGVVKTLYIVKGGFESKDGFKRTI